MGKALVIICLASIVAIVAMAAIVMTSLDHREEVELHQDILATKTAESKDFPTISNRHDAIGEASDSVHLEESKESGD